jgi:DNA-binding NarL/FixJ family response regulator
MFSSRVIGAAQALAVPAALVADPDSLPGRLTTDCRLVIIDLALERLNLPAAVRAVKAGAPQARVVAFGAHVEEAALAEARNAGCDAVLTRGQFHKQYAELLRAIAEQ